MKAWPAFRQHQYLLQHCFKGGLRTPCGHQWPISPVVFTGQHSRISAVASQPGAEAKTGQTLAATAKPVKQTLDYTALYACCQELAKTWVPARVEEVVQPDRYTVCLRLRTLHQHGWLHLSWHPTASRVCTGPPPSRGAAAEAFSFAEMLTWQLAGRVLLGVEMPAPWERVVELNFGVRPGEEPSHRVYCEIMGKYSNVILTHGNGNILMCAFQVGEKMSSLRQVQQGRSYTLPPLPNGISPVQDNTLQSWRETVTRAAELAASESKSKVARQPQISDGWVRAYQGTSPSLVEELCFRAGVDRRAHPNSLEDGQWEAAHQQWLMWMERVASGSFSATLDEGTGRFSVLGSYSQQYSSVLEMLSEYYVELQGKDQHMSLHQRLTATLTAALKRVRGRVAAYEKQLQGAEEAEAVRKQADLLTANLYRMKAGDSEVTVEDWDTGEERVIRVDPEKSPSENSEALYKRARKLRRAVDAVSPLVGVARGEVEYLEEVEVALSQLKGGEEVEDLKALMEVQDELVEAGVLKPPAELVLASKAASKAKKAAKKGARRGGAATGGPGFRQFMSPQGFQVLVGRNNRQNDELSLKVANEGDLWMHIKGMPGSHTVLRIPSGRDPGDEDIQFAADLAAYFSKGRNETKAEVIVTKASNVRKPRGANPGQVTVTGEKGWMARPWDSIAARSAAEE